MSRFYVESNDESARELFEKRNYYDSKLSKTGYKNVVDFNFGEKFFYGRVNRTFVPITLERPTKRFKKTNAPELGLSAVNFVVDAFYDMAQQFDRCALYGSIDTSDPFLTSLRIYKAYQNPTNLYKAHRTAYFGTIAGMIKGTQTYVLNFDDFVDKLKPILKRTTRRNPITKVGFVKSHRCPILSSGLAIEIADLDPSVDQDKIDRFVNSNNWEFYLNACASYGFMVDSRMPWRLVADIGNFPTRSPMLDYAEKYGLNGPTAILNNYYGEVHENYYYQFKTNMLDLYNRSRFRKFLVTDDCEGRAVTRAVESATYKVNQFVREYPDSKILKLYFDIRIMEEETEMTDNEIELLIDDCIELYHQAGIVEAMNAFEQIINLPFDKRGSVSYIKKYVDANASPK